MNNYPTGEPPTVSELADFELRLEQRKLAAAEAQVSTLASLNGTAFCRPIIGCVSTDHCNEIVPKYVRY